MNEHTKVRMKWKLLGLIDADERDGKITCTTRMMNMDSGGEFVVTITHPTTVPTHETIAALRAAAVMVEKATGTPPSDPMAYQTKRLDG